MLVDISYDGVAGSFTAVFAPGENAISTVASGGSCDDGVPSGTLLHATLTAFDAAGNTATPLSLDATATIPKTSNDSKPVCSVGGLRSTPRSAAVLLFAFAALAGFRRRVRRD